MDFTSGGFVSGNIVVTSILIIGLIAASSKARILDAKGIIAAALLGFLVGCLGHWTWLLLLSIVVSHQNMGMSKQQIRPKKVKII